MIAIFAITVNAIREVLTAGGGPGSQLEAMSCPEKQAEMPCRLTHADLSFRKGTGVAGRWIRFWPWTFGSLRKVDDVDLEGNEGVVDLEREADEEARRLLYVGLTRARDLLIQALPEKTPDGGLPESLGPEAATLLTPAIPGTTSLSVFSISELAGLQDDRRLPAGLEGSVFVSIGGQLTMPLARLASPVRLDGQAGTQGCEGLRQYVREGNP
jgi:hypothetical protein